MRTATVHIPGDFEDAYLYMGWLVVVTAERSLRFYKLDDIVAAVGELAPSSQYVAELMFRHNEWLTGAQFASLMRTPSAAQNILDQFALFPKPHFEISPTIQFEEQDVRIGTNVVLDCLVYNRQVYIGSKDGLFSALVDWDAEAPVLPARFDRRLDRRCISLTGRFGAVVASCGDDGLLWSAEDAYRDDEHHSPQWTSAENKSIRARWLSNGIINYQTAVTPNLLDIRKARTHERLADDPGERVVTAIGEERTPLLGFLLSEIQRSASTVYDERLVQYIFNSETGLFLFTFDGHFFAVDIKIRKNRVPILKFSHTYKGAGTKILSAASTQLGAVLETSDRIWHFANGDWTLVFESSAISVRTFPNSKNCHNLISVTTEDGVYLVGVFDETRHLPTM